MPKRSQSEEELQMHEPERAEGTPKIQKTEEWYQLSKTPNLFIHEPATKVNSETVIGFDFDSTLVKTKTGAVIPKSRDDWVLFDPKVKELLIKLNSERFFF